MGIFNNFKRFTTNQNVSKYIQSIINQLQIAIGGTNIKLNSDNDYDFENKKLTNVDEGTNDKDVATFKQVKANKTLIDTNTANISSNQSSITAHGNSITNNRNAIATSTTNINTNKNNIVSNAVLIAGKEDKGVCLKLDGTTTMTGNINVGTKKITHLANPTANTDAANKQYVDGFPYKNIDLQQKYYIQGQKKRTLPQIKQQQSSLPSIAETNEMYVHINDVTEMKADLDMATHELKRLPNPVADDQPVTLGYLKNNALLKDASGNYNAGQKVIRNHGSGHYGPYDLPNLHVIRDHYLDLNGGTMKEIINMNNKEIINLSPPTADKSAVNRKYLKDEISQNGNQASHNENILGYLMQGTAQFSDELGNSLAVQNYTKLTNNFHTFNKRVMPMWINKINNNYVWQLGVNLGQAPAGKTTMVCEIILFDATLFNKAKNNIFVYNPNGIDLHHYTVNSFEVVPAGSGNFLYYHRFLIEYEKTAITYPYNFDIKVVMRQDGNDLSYYPQLIKVIILFFMEFMVGLLMLIQIRLMIIINLLELHQQL